MFPLNILISRSIEYTDFSLYFPNKMRKLESTTNGHEGQNKAESLSETNKERERVLRMSNKITENVSKNRQMTLNIDPLF